MGKHLVCICLFWALLLGTASAASKGVSLGTFDGKQVGKGAPAYYPRDAKATLSFGKGVTAEGTWLWVDSYGRVLKELKPNPDGKGLSFEVGEALTKKNFVVKVDAKQQEIGRTAFLVVPDYKPFEDYEVVLWGSLGSNAKAWEAMRQCGINGVAHKNPHLGDPIHHFNLHFYHEELVSNGMLEFRAFQHNQWARFMEARKKAPVNYAGILPTIQRNPCLNDPKFVEKWKQRIKSKVLTSAPMIPMGYSLGDEISISSGNSPIDFCHHPLTLMAFRDWLKKRYADLAKLNEQWGTAYKTWEEVRPLTVDETKAHNNPKYVPLWQRKEPNWLRELRPDEMPEPGGENYSSLSDHRSFMDTVWCGTLEAMRDYTKTLTPNLLAGSVGLQAPGAFGGYDYWKMYHTQDWMEMYSGFDNLSMTRSWDKRRIPQMKTGFGAGRAGGYALWDRLMEGDDGVIIWWFKTTWDPKKNRATTKSASARKNFIEYRRGLAKLIKDLPMREDAVGIYYSQRSIHVTWMWDSEIDATTWPRRFGSYEGGHSTGLNAFSSFGRALNDNGYMPHYVSYQQVAEGGLKKLGTKVLVLPKIFSMSKAEAEQVRTFVKEGGVVIADNATATFDGHGKRLKAGQLDKLFGIKRKTFQLTERNGDVNHCQEQPVKILKADHPVLKGVNATANWKVTEPGIVLDGGEALAMAGQVPAVIVKQTGKGRTYYLNVSYTRYRRERLQPDRVAGRSKLIANILAQAGVKTKTTLEVDGKPLANMKVASFQDGENWYYGIRANGKITQDQEGAIRISGISFSGGELKADLGLANARHLYDVRKGLYLGQTKKAGIAWAPWQATVIASLPYKVLKVEPKVTPQKDTALAFAYEGTVNVDSGKAGRHVIRLDVYGPNGAYYDIYSKTFEAPSGTAKGILRLAENDLEGAWKLVFTDAASGVKADASIKKVGARFREVSQVIEEQTKPDVLAALGKPAGFGIRNGHPFVRVPLEVYSITYVPAKGKVALSASKGWKIEPSGFEFEATPFKGEWLKDLVATSDTAEITQPLQITATLTSNAGEQTLTLKEIPAEALEKSLIDSFARASLSPPSIEVKDGKLSVASDLKVTGSALKGTLTLKSTANVEINPTQISMDVLTKTHKGVLPLTLTPKTIAAVKDLAVTTEIDAGYAKKVSLTQYLKIGVARKTQAAPKLDGKLDDACWKDAVPLGRFLKDKAEVLAQDQTESWICWDDQKVYLAAVAHFPKGAKLKQSAEKAERDAKIWSDDSLEFFFSHPKVGGTYFQFAVSSANLSAELTQGDHPYDPQWQHAATAAEDRYTVELAVPLKALFGKVPESGEIWRLNVNRNKFAGGTEYSAWACPHGNSKNVARFGYIVFLKP